MKYNAFIFFQLFLILVSCAQEQAIKTDEFIVKTDTMPLPKGLDSFITLKIGDYEIDIARFDKVSKFKGNIIILQGYNFPKHDWCEKAPDLCRKATAEGYCLIMPEMGKSIYADSFYEQTAAIFRNYPLRTWLTDTVFTHLQKYHNLLLPGQNNYLLGLSTGAHGAVLIALDQPELFSAVAALSGDYDQSKIPEDKLTELFYGSYSTQKERWETIDNPTSRIKEWKTPIYLGHGIKDEVVPADQTKLFYEELSKIFDQDKIKINLPEKMGHDYKYWGSETDAILDFFGSNLKS
jgi:S-formylglutathione hydrolase FrmB